MDCMRRRLGYVSKKEPVPRKASLSEDPLQQDIEWVTTVGPADGDSHLAKGELSTCNRDHMAHQVCSILCPALYRKCLLTNRGNLNTRKEEEIEIYTESRKSLCWQLVCEIC